MENQLMSSDSLIDLQLKPENGGTIGGNVDDIEMFALQSMIYTSLKDLMPSSPSPAASPTSGSSWKEIPIKDPLVQHAAWAYLQPMAEARDDDDRWWRRLLTDKCRGIWGCFNDVVLVMCRGLFDDPMSDDDRIEK